MHAVGGEDLLHVLAREGLALERIGGEVVEALAVLGEQRAGAPVRVPGQHHRRHVDVAAGPVGERVVAGGQRDRRRSLGVERDAHAELADHLFADRVHARQVVDGARERGAEHLFLRRPAAEQGDDLLAQLVARLQVAVLLRRVGDEAERRAARDDAQYLRRIEAEKLAADRMAGLVVGDDPPLLGVQPPRLLGADRLAQQRLVEVFAGHRLATGATGDDRPLVEGVGELGAGHPGRLARHVPKVDVGAERLALGVGEEDRLASLAVGRGDEDLAIEAAGAEQRVVELVDVVGGGDHDHRSLRALESVELDQELVERLLALAGAAVAAATAARAADRVELVDEDHRAPGLARLLEQPADAGGAAADEHLDEARARGGVEVDPGLGGDRAGQHRLAGSGRPEEEHAARRLGAEGGEAVGFLEPGGDVEQLLLGGVDPLDLLPEDLPGLARLDRLRLGFAHRAAQQREEDEHQGEHEEDAEDRIPVKGEFFDVPHRERRQLHPSAR